MKHIPLKIVPRVFYWALTFAFLFGVSQTAYAFEAEPTLWVQVPQWSDDWEKCAVDVPDSSCHWYITAPDNTFGEGFDWASAPWFDANGLSDVPSIGKNTALQKLQTK